MFTLPGCHLKHEELTAEQMHIYICRNGSDVMWRLWCIPPLTPSLAAVKGNFWHWKWSEWVFVGSCSRCKSCYFLWSVFLPTHSWNHLHPTALQTNKTNQLNLFYSKTTRVKIKNNLSGPIISDMMSTVCAKQILMSVLLREGVILLLIFSNN